MNAFPLSGQLIDGKASYQWLANNAGKVNAQVSICSAFLRSSILEDFCKRLPSKTPVRIISRWQLGDLLAGASDLESYEFCKIMCWEFYICTNFHGKVFAFPPNGILVGSANATASGLSLITNSNSEVCTVVEESELNLRLIDNLFLSGTLMTDELYGKMKAIYLDSLSNGHAIDWPASIYNEIGAPKSYEAKLFLSECFASNGNEILLESKCNSAESKADASLLSLPSGQYSRQVIAERFMQTKIYFLLLDLLKSNGGEIYFGQLTSAIHNNLIEDPAPYRRDIKDLVINLYSWIKNLGQELLSMSVDQPNHSQRIRLV